MIVPCSNRGCDGVSDLSNCLSASYDAEELSDATVLATCPRCDYFEHMSECADLDYAESGGGSEMVNDQWASA